MIDLHCHLLPGIDDGAADLSVSLEMARVAAEEGVTTIVCTPHILPTVYDNTGKAIRAAVGRLQAEIRRNGIAIDLLPGADVHLTPHLVDGLRNGRVLSINDSRYFLLEPPHHVAPPRFEEAVFGLMTSGYVPILTHPERLAWVDQQYRMIQRLARAGMLMQITAGSVIGKFGRRARHWAEKMLEDGLVDVLASDAHDPERRPPRFREALEIIAERHGADAARRLVLDCPRAILDNLTPSQLPPRMARKDDPATKAGFFQRTFDKVRRQ